MVYSTKATEKRSGFTLVETLIYLTMISVAINLFVGFGAEVTNVRNKAESKRMVQSDLALVLDVVKQRARIASDTIEPTNGNIAPSLRLDLPEPAPDNLFNLENGIIYLTEGVSDPQPLTSKWIDITKFEVTSLNNIGSKPSLIIKIAGKYRFDGSTAFAYEDEMETAVTLR